MKLKSAIVVATLVGAACAFAATDGTDDASGYGTWADGAGGNAAFSNWSLTSSGTSGFFLGDSVAQGFGDVNTSGQAFSMWANPNGPGNAANADRTFVGGALNVGQSFSIDLATAYRNGNKGVDLDISGVSVWNFNVGSDLYAVNAVDQGWTYAQDSVFALTVTQVSSTDVDVSLTRGTDVYSQSSLNVGGQIDGFGLYVSDTDAGDDLNNLHANNMAVTTAAIPEPGSMALLGLGFVGVLVARLRRG